MNRRHFIKTTSGLAGMLAIAPGVFAARQEHDPLFLRLTKANDAYLQKELRRQEQRATHRAFGAIPDPYGIPSANPTAVFIGAIVAACHTPESAFYQSKALIEPGERAVAFLLNAQHADGTIDMISTNFHSTPDTAFLFDFLGPAIELLREQKWAPAATLLKQLERFTINAGEALTTGGVHTPNHRWVVCAALARVNALFPNEKYIKRVDQWLAETVDQDPDGQYTEKSTSIYSAVVNQALATVARLLDRPKLLDYVRRNLDMTMYFVHPDGEVVTEASKRQDKYQRGTMSRYYYCYRWLSQLDQNGRYASMARQIEQSPDAQLEYMLLTFLTEPEVERPMPASAPLPTDYAKVFAYSNLARIRRNEISATVLAENSTLFSLRKGRAALEAVRLISAFFGKGQFVAEHLVEKAGSYRLHQKLEGVYFQPLTPEQMALNDGKVLMAPNGTLATTQKEKRALSNVQTLESTITVTEVGGKFSLQFEIVGTENVPIAIELAFRHGGKLRGVETLDDQKDSGLLREGTGEYAYEDQVIRFGPGRADHRWTQIRGGAAKWDGMSVYLTGFTPFRSTLEIS